MYGSLNGRIDALQVQYDALRERFSRRFDTMQTEYQRQHDATRADISRLRTENQRQHDGRDGCASCRTDRHRGGTR